MMPTGLGSVPGFLVLWLLLTVLLSLLASLGWPLLRRRCTDATPSAAALVFAVYAVMPPISAGLSAWLVMHPDWSATLIPAHCHGSNCDVHQPVFALLHPVGAALAAASCLVVLVLVFLAQRAYRRTSHKLRMLHYFSERAPVMNYSLVQSDQYIAWCAGYLSPRVYLSSALVDACSEEELEIVLAHEHAHAKRRDNLRHLIVRWATLAWYRQQRRGFLECFGEKTEAACDTQAADYIGNRDAVIQFLQDLPMVGSDACKHARLAFEATGREERITALRQEAGNEKNGNSGSNGNVVNAGQRGLTEAWWVLAMLWFAAPVLSVGPGHYLIEWLMPL